MDEKKLNEEQAAPAEEKIAEPSPELKAAQAKLNAALGVMDLIGNAPVRAKDWPTAKDYLDYLQGEIDKLTDELKDVLMRGAK